jgi:hypothetical protein
MFLLSFSCSEDRIGENDFGTLEGTVVSIGLNEPLANVKISTQPISSTIFTDEFGRFSISEIAVGDYSVQAKKDGYLAGFEPVQILANRTVNVIFELEVSTANNKPPLAPVLLKPFENELLQSVEAVFEWTAEDPENDPMTYSLELRNDQNDDVLIFNDIEETTYTYSELILGAKYFWQVSADDDINEPVISPVSTFDVIHAPVDNRFLFVRTLNENNVIFSTDEEGNEFQLTSQNLNSFRPRRNVAANKIAYLQSNGAQADIFIMNRDGTEKTRVTSAIKPNGFNLNEINFSWPPGSDKIYFPNFDKLYRINTNGQGIGLVYQTPDGSFISEVDVSETGNIIALKTNDLNGYNISIFTIDFGGNVQEVILDGVPGGASGLNLSVTNQEVVYAYDVSGFESSNYRRLDSRIFIFNFIDGVAVDVSGDKVEGTNDLEPIFSPNEAEIIFTNTSNDGISQKDVFSLLINEDPIERTMLFSNGFMPDWE